MEYFLNTLNRETEHLYTLLYYLLLRVLTVFLLAFMKLGPVSVDNRQHRVSFCQLNPSPP